MRGEAFAESVVEQGAIEWPDGLGHAAKSGPETAPGEPWRPAVAIPLGAQDRRNGGRFY
jgi:hypothetical protein